MFRLIKLIIFCGFCYSAYDAWQHKEELLSKALSYVLSHPVHVKGVSVDWDGIHIQTLDINPYHSNLLDLSLKATNCTIQLSAWDFIKRPIPLHKVSIQNLSLTRYPSPISAESLFPNLAIKELYVERCYIEKEDNKGRVKESQEIGQCTFYNLGKDNPLDFSPPAWVASAPNFNPKTTRPRRLRRTPPRRAPNLGSGHIVY
jgi:hypothetical protein